MPVTKVKVNGEWIPAMPVGGGGEGDMTKAVYDTNDDGVVNAADQATKDGSGNVITSTYAAKATTLSGYGITDAKIENGSIILGSNSITPLTSFTETDPVFLASAAYGISSTDITNWDKIYGLFTVTSGNSDGDYWWVLKIPQSGLYRYTNAPGSSGGLKEIYLPHNGSSRNTVIINNAYTSSSNTLTLPNKTGTFALTSDIPTVPTNISAFTNDTGYITSYTETDPVFSASAAAGITSTDITNWNNKVSDTKTWGDVVAPDSRSDTSDNRYIPQFSATSSSSGTTATFTLTRVEPFSLGVPKWDYSNYLYAATPTSTDNSTKVATTAFVQTALGGYIASDTTANFTISDTAPSNPQTGDLWLDTNSQSASGIAYLPLSAGSSHPLSGNLVVNWDTSGDVQREIQLKADGNHVGKILETYNSSSDNGFGFYKTDTQNTATHGITLDSNGTNVVSGNNNNVYIRPNGYGNSTGQVYWDTDGVQHGGFPVTYGTVSINFWGESSNQQWEKYGRIIHLRLMRDFASARSNYGNPGTIVTLPTNLLPRTTVRASGVAFIDNVTWGGGTYYPVVISINPTGEMAVFGNTTYMVRCVGIQAEFSYVSAN